METNHLEKYLVYLSSSFVQKGKRISLQRLIMMLYLTDWKNCLIEGKQLTSVSWYFNHSGPFSNKVLDTIEKSICFEVFKNQTKEIDLISTLDECLNYNLFITDKERIILDFVVENTVNLKWEEFNKLVNSTFPMMRSLKYTVLDLPALVKEYKQINSVS
jgi:hypothetical protein